MPKIVFASPNVVGGAAVTANLPAANPDGTGSWVAFLTVSLPSGNQGTNDPVGLVVADVNGNSLLTVINSNDFWNNGVATFAFQVSPTGQPVSITNTGTVPFTSISIAEGQERQ